MTMIPPHIFDRLPALGPDAFTVFAMVLHQTMTLKKSPSLDELATLTGMSLKRVKAAFKVLEATGTMRTDKRA